MDKMRIGGIVFVVGLVLAAIIAIFSAQVTPAWAIFVLAVLGLIVGIMNIEDEEINTFLIASVTFLISFQALSSILTSLALGWQAVGAFFGLMTVFVAPAAAIVAVKALFGTAKN